MSRQIFKVKTKELWSGKVTIDTKHLESVGCTEVCWQLHSSQFSVCTFTGESWVHFSHHIHDGMLPEDRGVWITLSCWCLFTELLEYIRFCHCDDGVRHTHHSLNTARNTQSTQTPTVWHPLGCSQLWWTSSITSAVSRRQWNRRAALTWKPSERSESCGPCGSSPGSPVSDNTFFCSPF